MSKIVFKCETCGYMKVVKDEVDPTPVHTHMCDTGRIETIDGVVEEELKHSDICPLERAYKDEPNLYSLDDGEPV